MGLFKGDFKQILSRFTWEGPQTFFGYLAANVQNTFYGVRNVSYYGGATAVEYYSSGWGAFTLGSFINGERGLYADPNNSLFQHEYGHYLQSQSMGLSYISRVAIPSLISAMKNDEKHDYQSFEQDANRRAFLYFNKNVEGFYKSFDERFEKRGWDFYNNPLDVNHVGYNSRYDYYDYYDSNQMDLLNNLILHTKWYDYFGGLKQYSYVLPVSFINGYFYHRIKNKR